MANATEDQLSPEQETVKKAVSWQFLWLIPHLAAVYVLVHFCSPWLGGWVYGRLLPLLRITTSSSSRFEFFFSHLLIFTFVPAFFTGLLSGSFKHRTAQFVWVVPSVILAYRLITFASTASVLLPQSSSPFHYYFGGGFLIPEFRDWSDFWRIVRSDPDMLRGMDQHTFTAPFYAGIGYALASWISVRTDLRRRITDRVTRWEE